MRTQGSAKPPPAAAARGGRLAADGERGRQGAGRAGQCQGGAGAPAQGPEYAAGEKLFMTKGCMGCHSLQAVGAPKGLIGPNLANIGARSYIAAGWLPNTDENLARWIREPAGGQEGRPDAEPRRHGGRGPGAQGLPPRTPINRIGHGNDCPRPASRPRRPRREDRPVELAHDGRPQADRDPLRRHRVLLLPARRPRGADHPDPAGPAGQQLHRPRRRTTSCSRCTARP